MEPTNVIWKGWKWTFWKNQKPFDFVFHLQVVINDTEISAI